VERTDWTIFWRRLADAARDGDHAPVRDLFIDGARFDAWLPAPQQRDFSGVATLLELLESPFEDHAGHDAQAGFPPDWASTIKISCSS
jgi:uncharacterized protein YdiU (UPF0061 family)